MEYQWFPFSDERVAQAHALRREDVYKRQCLCGARF